MPRRGRPTGEHRPYAEQEAVLEAIGAKHIVNSAAPDFREQLTAAVRATGATLAFDAVGGGPLAGQILAAMEDALIPTGPAVDQYGSRTHKQVYVYGRLDLAPTTVPPTVGMAWSLGGWLLFSHLARIGQDATRELRERVANEITTTFASSYRVKFRWQRRSTLTPSGAIGARQRERNT